MEPIAIIGIGCRYPGNSNTPEAFWRLLAEGRDAVRETPADRWNLKAFYSKRRGSPGKMVTRWGGFIDDIGLFDAGFFGVSPREAAHIDPQHRWLLETAFEAFEDGGQRLDQLAGAPVGVFVGISSNDYADIQKRGRTTVDVHTNSGSAISIAANRISYLFDLRGPSLAVDTACSSALVALDLACQNIWRGECAMAVAGGVNALLTPDLTIGFSKAGMLSPDGRCKAFDARGNGYVRAEGAGALLLKPLSKAVEDGDSIYAVINATYVNQDGKTGGMTVPSSEQQVAMLREAYKRAGVSPAAVGYMEAHGTGTPVGDPIELNALGKVLSANRPADRPLVIGSVKTNIGHLESGSGIAGVVKVALALKHGQIPRNLHFEEPNPDIEFERYNIKVPTELTPWPGEADGPRVGGVNSFGFGGTNCHVVMSSHAPAQTEAEAPVEPRTDDTEEAGARNGLHLLPVSGQTPDALKANAAAFADFLVQADPREFRHICAAAALRRSHHDLRLVARARTAAEAAELLRTREDGEKADGLVEGRVIPEGGDATFVFTGQGPQWWGMGQELIRTEPIVRDTISKIDALLRPHTGWSLLEEMTRSEASSRISRTDVAQPAIFALQVALAELWRGWGVEARRVTGHSVGEVAAAYWAGIYSLEDAVKIIHHRSRLQETTRGHGRMAAVGITPARAMELLAGQEGKVCLAAVNSPQMVTIAGDTEAVEAMLKPLEAEVFLRYLKVDYAFHTHQMDPIREDLLEVLADIEPQAARIPFISTVTGRLIDGKQLTADYWWRNVREAVRFGPAVENILDGGGRVFLELGPHPALGHSVRECLASKKREGQVLGSLNRKASDWDFLLENLSALHALGHPVAWERFYPGPCPHRELPRYQWQKDHNWEEADFSRHYRLAPQAHPLLGVRSLASKPTYAYEISNDALPYLDDHRIHGREVFPGAGYVEMILAAARVATPEALPEGPQSGTVLGLDVSRLSFEKPLFINGSHPVETVLSPDDGRVEIASRAQGWDNPEWETHAWGTAIARDMAVPAKGDPDAVRASLGQGAMELDQAELYKHFHSAGHDFGPLFQPVRSMVCVEGEALARVRLPAELTEEAGEYLFHPVLLDGCFQALRGTQRFHDTEKDETVFLPVGIDRLRVFAKPGTEVYSHVRVSRKTDDILCADIAIYALSGRPVATIEGFTCHKMDSGKGRVFEGLEDAFYQYRWEPLELPDEPAEAVELGRWLIAGGGIAEALAKRLRAAGAEEVVPASFDAFPAKLKEAEWRGVVLSPDLGDSFDADRMLAVADEMLLASQALAEAEGVRVYMLTRGCEAVAEGDAVNPAEAVVKGVGRVLITERPELRVKIADVEAASEEVAEVLCKEIVRDSAPEEFAIRGGKLHALTLRRVDPGDLPLKSMTVASHSAKVLEKAVGSNGHGHQAANGNGSGIHLNGGNGTGQETAESPASAGTIEAAPGLGNGGRIPTDSSGANGTDRVRDAGMGNGSRLANGNGHTNGHFDADAPGFRLETSKPGSLDNLFLLRTERAAPAANEVEVAIKAIGLNFRDVLKAMGMYPLDDGEAFWFGDECSGVVTRVGPGVEHVMPGDPVMAVAPACFGNFVTVPAPFVVRKPQALSFTEAATCPIVFLTAHYCLNHLGRLGEEDSILIHAASGGVGQAAIQFAKIAGARIFATTSEGKRGFIAQQGVDHILNSRTLDFADDIRRLTAGEGVDVVINSLAGEFLTRSLELLKPYGRFLEIGKRDIFADSRIGLAPFKNNLSFFAVDLAKVLKDKPLFLGRMLREVAEHFEAGRLKPLNLKAFPMGEVAEAFRFMAQGKHIGKIVVTHDAAQPIRVAENEALTVSADGAYLVTGGLSGFGLETARWLVERGARHLALASRSGAAKPEAAEAVRQLEEQGAIVEVLKVDVSDKEALADALEECRLKLPPLKGVVHSAMVLDDGFIHQLTPERMRRVLLPKAVGAWNLHELTREDDLDFFVMYSSIAAVLGSSGQANYAAANLFLDALARARRAEGLPALAVNWGALGAAGVVARDEKLLKYLDSLGLKALDPKHALDALGFLLSRDAGEIAAAPVRWERMAKVNPALRRQARFSGLVEEAQAGDGGGDTGHAVRNRILALPETEREAAVLDYLRKTMGRILGTPAGKVQVDQPLTALGLDSLMGFEMKNQVDSELGINLQIGSFMQGATLGDLPGSLLEQMGTGEAAAESLLQPLDEYSDTFPLTQGQRALWFLHRLAPDSAAYNLVFSARFQPALDIGVLKRAFAELFRQNPMLDVTFSVAGGEPVQTLRRGRTVDIVEHDTTAQTEDEAKALVVERANQPFDLERGPVVRLELFRRPDDAHITLLSMHHIVSDAWSVALLMRDLMESYFAIVSGARPRFEAPQFRYEDFVRWEQRLLQSPEGGRMLEHWRKALDGAPQMLDLPTDHPRPPMQTFDGATHGFKLDEALTAAVKKLAESRGATLFTTLLSVYQVLMHRYTGQEDILVGSPFAGRSRGEFHQLIGYFINPAVLRSRSSEDPPFAEFLDRASDTVTGALENQSYPFPLLVDQLKVPREPSRSPLFQVSFSMESVPEVDEQGIAVFLIGQGGHQFSVGDLKVESVDLTLRMAQFEISLVLEEAGGHLYGCWQYNRNLFEPETIAHLNRLFEHLLRQITAAPDKRIGEYSLIDAHSAQQLESWNATSRPVPAATLTQLVADGATKQPDKSAVEDARGGRLTHSQLQKRADAIASALLAKGVARGAKVPLMMQRSVDMVAAALGIMRAGGSYVPLDPAFPRYRLRQILDDLSEAADGPLFMLTERELADGEVSGVEVLYIEDLQTDLAKPLPAPPKPEDVAYTIYTSGSTGRPKGVEIPHSAAVNFLTSMAEKPGLREEDTLLAVTTLSFDISVLELFLPLAQGGRVVIASEEQVVSAEDIGRLLEEKDITVMQATPATWRMLIDGGWSGHRGLKALCGGEALPRELAASLLPKVGELWNLFGPTETTVWSTVERITETDGEITIGRPIANTTIALVDGNDRPLPPGAVGRMLIGGDGLARGYFNRPELTAERFVELSLDGGEGRRYYRTGDLARWRLDGRLEFLGRSDFQVKLRGHRIELGDIERQLASHPAVSQAVVALREDSPGRPQLVAYIVGDAGVEAELRELVRDRLPDYMGPSAYVFLAQLPHTPNRKVDRKRLPKPEGAVASAQSIAPRTSSEFILRDIFAEAFEGRQIGVTDNFFELGGDSLLAVKIVAEVGRAFNRQVPVHAFLRHPTIETLARHLEEEATEEVQEDYATDFDPDAFSYINELEEGAAPTFDAAALAYLPDSLPGLLGLSRREIVDKWMDGESMVPSVYHTQHGSIGLIVLPMFGSDLYRQADKLPPLMRAAASLARDRGAGCISLTGLIPSATGYGGDIAKWLGDGDWPMLTTGHPTTTATVVKNIEGMLSLAGRGMAGETAAFVGLGSIGRATLDLVLKALPHPRRLVLCDIFQKAGELEELAERLRGSGFAGEISVAAAKGQLPDSVYDASLVVGATNVPGVVDINRVAPGCLIVDDSFPPCYNLPAAIARLRGQGDILFTTGGNLRLPEVIREDLIPPKGALDALNETGYCTIPHFVLREANQITGCILSSLLTLHNGAIKPSLGPVSIDDSLACHNLLGELGITFARPQCEGFFLPQEAIERFGS